MKFVIRKHFKDDSGEWLEGRLPITWTDNPANARIMHWDQTHMISGWLISLGISHDIISLTELLNINYDEED